MTSPDPIDLEPHKGRPKSSRVNPIMWGGTVALLAAVVVAVGEPSPNPLLQNPLSAAAVGFFFGWAAGSLRNWFGRKLPY